MKKEDLQRHIETQLRNIMCADVDIGNCIDAAINRTNVCLNAANNSYYNRMAIGGLIHIIPVHMLSYFIFCQMNYIKEMGMVKEPKKFIISTKR